ncbi:MAG: membrane integrity-associated transporter subunit PqiC [Deltaproteobacteria bacterium]|nr:membrane integrity-associated transporter subunit PqiC [Deltaproteobacteria bacterium]
MIARRRAAALACALAAVASHGCLFRSAEPPRFYRPASAALDDAGDDARVPTAAGAPLRLGSVRSAPFLRERVVWRASPVEYGLYDQRRWFELPSRYVRRALVATLRTTPGVRLVQEATAALLDVEVLAFDEALAPAHEAHVALAVTLRNGADVRLDRVFSAKAPIARAEGGAMAEAMGRALDEATRRAAAAAAAALAAQPGSRSRLDARGGLP